MPPCASGPVFTVRRPSLNGSDCAMAGVGKRPRATAAPAAVPANTARRLTVADVSLRDIRFLPATPILGAYYFAACTRFCGAQTRSKGAACAAAPPSASALHTIIGEAP